MHLARSCCSTSHGSPVTTHDFPGGHTAGVTPVPIPNTVVKPRRADDTALVTAWERRSPPGLITKGAANRFAPFFFLPYVSPGAIRVSPLFGKRLGRVSQSRQMNCIRPCGLAAGGEWTCNGIPEPGKYALFATERVARARFTPSGHSVAITGCLDQTA